MRATTVALTAALAVLAAMAWGQPRRGDPHLGYLYPAGGQQGSTFRLTAGGQFLQGANAIYVTGGGVQASVAEFIRPLTNKDLGDIGKHLRELSRQRVAEAAGKPVPAARPKPAIAEGKQEEPLPPLPDHPLLRGLEQKSLAELAALRDILFSPKKQPNPQIAETVAIDVTIDPAAAPGDRELRLGTPMGLTNPIIFQVGSLPEASEQEPNDPKPGVARSTQTVLGLPVTLNGQIEPGGVDRFRLRAAQGQRLVMRTQARHLIPYLADAVPGWFQATIALYDSKGNELAFVDDYRFDPDPVLFYEIPAAGEYELEIHDSIYRGREDFVYRISAGELPFITQLFPLGGQAGVPTVAAIDGWNLPTRQLTLDTQPAGNSFRQAVLIGGALLSNAVAYQVGDVPECAEAEPNDTAAQAQRISLPQTVNGRIAKAGDVDLFQFSGRASQETMAEVYARRLDSPLDSLLRLTDAKGRVLEWNDDHEDKASGLSTHHADSYLRAKLPADGTYRLELSDSEHGGGEAYAYRLRLAAPRPDFALRVSPASINVRAGGAAAVWVHALRRDGFDGEIGLALTEAAAGFRLDGARIPAGRESIRVTLSTPPVLVNQPVPLSLEGRAQIGEQAVTHPAAPAEDMMQAFIYRHLTPAQQTLVKVVGAGRFAPVFSLADPVPVRLPTGGTAQMRVSAPRGPLIPEFHMELNDPPKGLSLEEVSPQPGGLALVLKADAGDLKVGYIDNLIVDVFVEMARKLPDGKTAPNKRRVPLGVLPAIPFEVVPG